MEEIRVNSWNELQEQLFRDAWQADLQRYRSPYAFRGVTEAGHPLETTLARLGGDYAGIVNQYALFSLMSDAQSGFEAWLRNHQDYYRKIILPSELKWEVRDKLDQANITERVLFPGLDGLSNWLRRQYTSRGNQE